MQTCRHWIFSALAVSALACGGRTLPRSQAVCPEASAEAGVEPEAEPKEMAPPAPARLASAQPRPPVQGAPVLRRVRLTARDMVLLHFSEPVTAAAGINPEQFRLSLASLEREEDGYTELYYYDPQGEGDPALASRVAAVVTDDEHTLRLVLARPLDPDLCEEFNAMASESEQDPNVQGGLFLHYRDDDQTGIADREGVHLQDIAASWVERGSIAIAYMGVNAAPIEAFGPIRCSFEP